MTEHSFDPTKPRKSDRSKGERQAAQIARSVKGGGFADQKIVPTKQPAEQSGSR